MTTFSPEAMRRFLQEGVPLQGVERRSWDEFAREMRKHYPGGQDHDQSTHGHRGGGEPGQAWAPQASGRDLAHLEDYTYFVGTNGGLRGGHLEPAERRQVEAMDRLMALPGAALEQDVVAYRAWVGAGPDKPVGSTFVDRGFTSTTLSDTKAEEFMRAYQQAGLAPVRVVIDVPAGTRGLYLDKVPEFSEQQRVDYLEGQFEEATARATEPGPFNYDLENERARTDRDIANGEPIRFLTGDSELVLARGLTYEVTGRDEDGTVHLKVMR